jgi:hypothetical protein
MSQPDMDIILAGFFVLFVAVASLLLGYWGGRRNGFLAGAEFVQAGRAPQYPCSPHCAGYLRERAAAATHAEVLEALRAVVNDVLDYERVNNLAPNPGRKYCWDSVARAAAAIAKTTGTS